MEILILRLFDLFALQSLYLVNPLFLVVKTNHIPYAIGMYACYSVGETIIKVTW